jgi:hypothetical protein
VSADALQGNFFSPQLPQTISQTRLKKPSGGHSVTFSANIAQLPDFLLDNSRFVP